MGIKEQVVSLELAKKLKVLGVKQESLFYWDEGDGVEDRLEYSPNTPLLELIPAYTVAELGLKFPQNYGTRYDGQGWSIYDGDGKYVIGMSADTEADARAKMLIYLLENKIISL